MPTDAKTRLLCLVQSLDDDTAALVLPEVWRVLVTLLLPAKAPKARPEVRQ